MSLYSSSSSAPAEAGSKTSRLRSSPEKDPWPLDQRVLEKSPTSKRIRRPGPSCGLRSPVLVLVVDLATPTQYCWLNNRPYPQIYLKTISFRTHSCFPLPRNTEVVRGSGRVVLPWGSPYLQGSAITSTPPSSELCFLHHHIITNNITTPVPSQSQATSLPTFSSSIAATASLPDGTVTANLDLPSPPARLGARALPETSQTPKVTLSPLGSRSAKLLCRRILARQGQHTERFRASPRPSRNNLNDSLAA